MACKHKKYDPADPEDRRRVIASAVASQNIEGLELDQESMDDLSAFVSGELSIKEIKDRALARFTVPDPSSDFTPGF